MINRDDRREPIFRDDSDRRMFLQTFGQACAMADWQVPPMVVCRARRRPACRQAGDVKLDRGTIADGDEGALGPIDALGQPSEKEMKGAAANTKRPFQVHAGDIRGCCAPQSLLRKEQMRTELSVCEAQARLPRLVRSKETIKVQSRERTVAFIVPRERMEALLETMEILSNPAAMRAVWRNQSGKGNYLPLSALDEDEG